MKTALFLLSLSFMSQAQAMTPEAKQALNAIDVICGDTWCSGDLGYKFTDLTFPAGKAARVKYDIWWNFKNPVTVATSPLYRGTVLNTRQSAECVIQGFGSPEAVVSGNVVNWDFYEAMTECVQSLEGNFKNLASNNVGKKSTLYGSGIVSSELFHAQISDALSFPEFYGKNLEALRDVLRSSNYSGVTLVWKNSKISAAALGGDFDKIVSVLRAIEAEGQGFSLILD